MQDKIKHSEIYPNPDQPRKVFDEKALAELAQSISENGLLEPIVVVKRKAGFMIVAGERRWRACGMAGLKKLPCRIIRANAKKVTELALLENLQRQDLNPIEEAMAYRAILDNGTTIDELAKKMGFKQPWRIKERMDLLKLHPEYQRRLQDKHITPTQAFELCRLSHAKQHLLYEKIKEGRANTWPKLRALTNALLVPPMQQTGFCLEISNEEKAVGTKCDRMVELLTGFVKCCFSEKDLKILPKVTGSNVQVNIEQIEHIVNDLNRIKNAMIQAQGRLEVAA